MGLATHFGPWLLGTQKNTGVVSGTAVNRNIGATVTCQTTTINYTTPANTATTGTNTVVIPGGALFLGGYMIVTSPYNWGNGDSVMGIYANNGSSIIQVVQDIDISFENRQSLLVYSNPQYANVLFLPNTSALSPTKFSFITSGTGTAPTQGSVTVFFEYAVRNPDGSTI